MYFDCVYVSFDCVSSVISSLTIWLFFKLLYQSFHTPRPLGCLLLKVGHSWIFNTGNDLGVCCGHVGKTHPTRLVGWLLSQLVGWLNSFTARAAFTVKMGSNLQEDRDRVSLCLFAYKQHVMLRTTCLLTLLFWVSPRKIDKIIKSTKK